jgi:protein gp37
MSKFNATNDNIEWAKWTWNPVTGCKQDCQYCYAKSIANRFYPEKFEPTFRPERLSAAQNTVIPKKRKDEPGIRNVFVCSMADLFGEWVPVAWIREVLTVCHENPQWNFIFLTKNPERYLENFFDDKPNFTDNCWVGATADTQERMVRAMNVFSNLGSKRPKVTFVSCEPLLEEISFQGDIDWLIIGGKSATGKQPEQPEWEWVEKLLAEAREGGISVYFKPNLTVTPKEYPQ